ncbi:PEP-CTERM sorting domain-containing protein [Mariniblastus sp.]|nr:PEP-CTERM sorting domain-containing protein [Mariniblastus sp.]
MKLSIKNLASFMLVAAAFTVGGLTEANGQVFVDTFDAAPTNGATRSLSIDNSTSSPAGTFPGSTFDVFGIVDRNVSPDFSDNSVELTNDGDPDTNDTFGLVTPDKDDFFLGFADTANTDNPDGNVNVTWTVDVSGQTDLMLLFDVAAIGDFEPADLLTFSASFDGGTDTVVATGTGSDVDPFTYTLENGELAIPFGQTDSNISDPFVFGDNIIVNEFERLAFPILETGTELTLTLNYVGNGAPEILAVDNVQVTSAETSSIPEPASLVMTSLACVSLSLRRRR